MLLDREVLHRENRRLDRLLRAAKLRVTACIEDIDYRPGARPHGAAGHRCRHSRRVISSWRLEVATAKSMMSSMGMMALGRRSRALDLPMTPLLRNSSLADSNSLSSTGIFQAAAAVFRMIPSHTTSWLIVEGLIPLSRRITACSITCSLVSSVISYLGDRKAA